MQLPYDLQIPILGIYPKKPETLTRKNISTPVFVVALFTITKIWKEPKCPSVDEWIKQLFTQCNTIRTLKDDETFTL